MGPQRLIQRVRRAVGVVSIGGSLAALMVFAGLASGAARVDTGRPRNTVAVFGIRIAPARNLAAGDQVERVIDLRTGGRTRSVLVVSAKAASPLTDPVVGLRLQVDACSKPWRRAAGRKGYRCRGRVASVAADRPVLGRHLLTKLRRRRKNHLRLTLTLPRSAPNALEGQRLDLVYRFR